MKQKCRRCPETAYPGKYGEPPRGWILIMTGNKKPRRNYYCKKHKEEQPL